jgi:hypothetical protein
LYATLFTVSEDPAEPDAVIVPSLRPLQLILVALAVTVTVAGCVITTVLEAVQVPLLAGTLATIV